MGTNQSDTPIVSERQRRVNRKPTGYGHVPVTKLAAVVRDYEIDAVSPPAPATYSLIYECMSPVADLGRSVEATSFAREMVDARIHFRGHELNPYEHVQELHIDLNTVVSEDARDNLLLHAAELRRGLYLAYEDRILARGGHDQESRELTLKQRYNDVPGARLDGGKAAVDRIVITTAAKAVRFDDEDFLSLVQECCFELGNSPIYRSGLAKFLHPYDLRTYGSPKWTADRLQEKSEEAAQIRLDEILCAADPFLYVRAGVRDKFGVRHRKRSAESPKPRPRIISIESLKLPTDKGEEWEERLPGRFTAAELCYEFTPETWAEIAAQLDERTAEELSAFLEGRLTPAQVGMKNYKHFLRQMDRERPSKLQWMILSQRAKGLLIDYPKHPTGAWGSSTSYRDPVTGWNHSYGGAALEELRRLNFDCLPVGATSGCRSDDMGGQTICGCGEKTRQAEK